MTPHILLRRCGRCDVHFEHADGASCPSCDRAFCGPHYYGGGPFWRLFRKERMICLECRNAEREGQSARRSAVSTPG